jgi:hypothetical protein
MLRNASPSVFSCVVDRIVGELRRIQKCHQSALRIQVVRIGTFEISDARRFREESDETVWQPEARYSSFLISSK